MDGKLHKLRICWLRIPTKCRRANTLLKNTKYCHKLESKISGKMGKIRCNISPAER